MQQLDRSEQKDPRIEAALRAAVAETYRSLSLLIPSKEQWQKALNLETQSMGTNTPEAARAMAGLGGALTDVDQLDEAGRLLNQAVAV